MQISRGRRAHKVQTSEGEELIKSKPRPQPHDSIDGYPTAAQSAREPPSPAESCIPICTKATSYYTQPYSRNERAIGKVAKNVRDPSPFIVVSPSRSKIPSNFFEHKMETILRGRCYHSQSQNLREFRRRGNRIQSPSHSNLSKYPAEHYRRESKQRGSQISSSRSKHSGCCSICTHWQQNPIHRVQTVDNILQERI